MIRKDVREEIKFEIETYRTNDKKAKRKAFQKVQKLDLLGYHYFSQEYDAVKSAYILFHLYVRFGKRRYLCGAISVHISGMNKILRNVFFGTEFFGKFRKYILETYGIKAKFVTISRFVLFPQFRGIGLARKFAELVTDELEKDEDIFLIEIFSSMLYNFDFMPKTWVKYSNVVNDSFEDFASYSAFCKATKLVKSVADARKMLQRAIKKVDDGGRVRAADMSCPQTVLHAKRVLKSIGDDELVDQLDSKKRNQVFRTAKQTHKRVSRASQYIQRKSGSMYNRMNDADAFVNIASFMFYIPPDKFHRFCEFFFMNQDVVSYDGLLYSYKDCVDVYMSKMLTYKKKRKQLPIFVELYKQFCDIDRYVEFEKDVHKRQLQKGYMALKDAQEVEME
jgi:hypothetical protein